MKPTTPFASNIHRRFRPTGKIVARRPLVVGAREVQIGEEIAESEFEPRRRWLLWEQNWIDTPEPEEPSEAEMERLTAPQAAPVARPAQPQAKQQQARR